MNLIDRVIAQFAPQAGLDRARARMALKAVMNYDAATTSQRASSWRPVASDADAASQRRHRLAYLARDMVRNTPYATRAQHVIANNVVGDGIIPKIIGGSKSQRADLLDMIEQHLDTVAIDADGRNNLYGLQRMALNAVVDAGEVLIRRRFRQRGDGLPLALQLQVLEPDYIDSSRDGVLPDGNEVREGIEYDQIGRRVAYWLFSQHPGGVWRRTLTMMSRRVPASEILHIYRQDRPGQMRGVSWYAPIALSLQDLHDHQDAQLLRQKIAACFAAFRVTPDGESGQGGSPSSDDRPTTLTPGMIRDLAPGEDIRFTAPPGVEAYDEFTRSVLRSAASGIGITYEALSGDLSNVNFTSYKAGRIEMDRNVTSWQWLMMVPQMMHPIGRWIIEAWALERMIPVPKKMRLDWVPPTRPLIDPAREVGALRDKVRAGFASRQSVIRELGHDPERVLEEQVADAAAADGAKLKFDSDARVAVPGQPGGVNDGAAQQTDPSIGQKQDGAKNGK